VCEAKQGGSGWSDLQQKDAVGRNALDANPTDWPVYRSEIVIIHLPTTSRLLPQGKLRRSRLRSGEKDLNVNEIGNPSIDYRQSELGASGQQRATRCPGGTTKISADFR
jgi:hypothetical protein